MLPVHGFVARGFERVRDAFAANVEHHGDVGAACAVYRAGQPVVGFGYVTTRMKFDLAGDARTKALVAATYQALR